MTDRREQQLSNLSSEYANRATRLSNRLEEFEDFLGNLAGKTRVNVTVDNVEFDFDRYGEDWRIGYREGTGWELVSGSPLQVKVKAAIAAPMLLDEIIAKQTQLLSNLDEALNSLDSILNQKEG